jgi:hypothetical protein
MPATKMIMRALFYAATLLTAAVTTPAHAGDEAVSDINLTLGGFGGFANPGTGAEGLYGLTGSIAMPIEEHLGFQLDGAVAGDPGEHFFDLGAHLFWRDAHTGLLGVYAGMARSVDVSHHLRTDRYGLEGAKYLANTTLSGAVGYETGQSVHGVYGNAKLDYYLTPNFMTSGGLAYEAGKLFYSSRAEYQLRTDHELGFAFFASSDWHASDTYQMLGGLRLTIGEALPLQDRYRHQNTPGYLNADLLGTELSE